MFCHRLIANGIGGRTVFDLDCRLNGIDPADLDSEDTAIALRDEFFRWMAYDQIYPIGYQDLHFGRFMHLYASANTPKNKTRPKLKDFLIGEMPKHQMSAEELEQKLNGYFSELSNSHQ